jgi:hypothetical protein
LQLALLHSPLPGDSLVKRSEPIEQVLAFIQRLFEEVARDILRHVTYDVPDEILSQRGRRIASERAAGLVRAGAGDRSTLP